MRTFKYIISERFKGYKSAVMSTNYDSLMPSHEYFKDKDIRGKEVIFEESFTSDGHPMMTAVIEGRPVGYIFDSTLLGMFWRREIEEVHIRYEEELVWNGKCDSARSVARLFIKRKGV